jgi:uncharacterized protein (DUF302 family)
MAQSSKARSDKPVTWQLVAEVFVLIALLWTPARAQAPVSSPDDVAGLVVIGSAFSMAETEQRLVQAIESAGLKVAARIDHEANAKRVDQALPPTVLLLFGNPKTGTPLIKQRRTMGIDLPLKILFWEEEGKVKLAYNDPFYLARRHGVENATVLTQVEKALRGFADAATKQ